MKNMLPYILFYGAISFLAVTAGALLPLLRKWDKKKMRWLMALGAGVLIGAALLHIVPEAIKLERTLASVGMLLSFSLIFAIEQFFLVHSCPDYDEECDVHQIGYISFLALLLHSGLDGLAIAAGFRASIAIGFAASAAVITHDFSDGLSTCSLLVGTGHKKSKAFIFSILVALATPLVAVTAYLFLVDITNSGLAFALGLSAGSFLYIGASDILPRIHRVRDYAAFLSFVVGVLLIAIPSMIR